MGSIVTLSPNKSLDIYHDIYDFSIFGVCLGDMFMWGIKSALRAAAVGRKKVHVHLICEPNKFGFNPLQGSDYLADLLVVEALPVFYSHPYFSGLSLYRSRKDFQAAFARIAEDDEVSRNVYLESESKFKDRDNFNLIVSHYQKRVSYHDDINEYYRQTGTVPKVGYLEDCLIDWQALQAQFPKETFWVTVQFRMRIMDSGLPGPAEYLERDAPFLTWYNFIREAHQRYPFVRFVLVGRLQEKPLEVLRLPNVVSLRPLGMNLGHEIAAIINSDLYMGSISGFAVPAQFNDVPYHLFNCPGKACEFYGIPYGTDRLINANSRQKIHYGPEDGDLLLECLKQALHEAPKKTDLPGKLEINCTTSTNRFFINDRQNDAELSSILSNQLMAIAFKIECGEYTKAQDELRKLGVSFPEFAPNWSDYRWLSDVLDQLLRDGKTPDPSEAWSNRRRELLAQVSGFCHPGRLIRRNGRHFDIPPGFEGLQREGWCEQKARFVFAPSTKGDFLVIQVAGLASSEPIGLSVRINGQQAMPFVLLNEYATLEIPIHEACIPTEVTLEADRSFKVHSRDEKKYSYQLKGAGLISGLAPMPPFYRGDKRASREKITSGIYANGSAGSLTRIRIDNPFPDNVDVMAHLIARLPQSVRRGQHLRLRINDDPAHEAFIYGKHLEAVVPCPGRPRHISVLLQFWDQNGSEIEPKENCALIKSMDVLPATVTKAEIKSGYRGAWSYLINKLKSKKDKR